MNNISQEISTDDNFNILNILSIDHSYLKECICVLTNDNSDKHEKLFYARTFLDTLKKHSHAEEKTLYDSLSEMDELRSDILEGKASHSLVNLKSETLINRLSRMKILDDITEAELKVLALVIHHHIEDEENILFPKIWNNLDRGILNEIGFQFMILRRFTPQDLKDHPELQRQIYQGPVHKNQSRKNIYQWSANFVKKVNRYIGSLVIPNQPQSINRP